ncbi:MAG: LamB/YcsF family protein [Fimbriimonadaceae bacterium]
MKKIDLNVDIGEGFPHDEELLAFATSANICCGEHAGSKELTQQTVDLCARKKIRVGAHPGYPDRENMGRRSMGVDQHRAYLDSIFEQMRWFVGITEPAYIKPHGAFYNDTAVPMPTSWEPYEGLLEPGVPFDPAGIFISNVPGAGSLGMLLRVHKIELVGLAGTAHEMVAKRSGRRLIREGFADRAYRKDGTLVPRSEDGAILKDPKSIKTQILALAPNVDTICLHGDTPGCVEFAEMVVATLRDSGYRVAA